MKKWEWGLFVWSTVLKNERLFICLNKSTISKDGFNMHTTAGYPKIIFSFCMRLKMNLLPNGFCSNQDWKQKSEYDRAKWPLEHKNVNSLHFYDWSHHLISLIIMKTQT